MSMNYYPCHEYGLYIPKDDFKHLIQKYKEVNDLNELDDDEVIDYYLKARDIDDTYNDYNACTLLIDRTEEIEGYFLPSQKNGSIFRSDTHLLYNTPQDMADEFKAEFDELLPKDFDYVKNLAVYEYVYCS